MSAISETYNRVYNILELVDIFPNVSLTTCETKVDITNRNGKYEFTNELPNDIRLKKIVKPENFCY